MNATVSTDRTQISLVVDKAVKEKAYENLKRAGLKPSDMFRDVLHYIATTGEPPIKRELLSAEDRELLIEAKKVLANPGKITRVKLDDLDKL
ncbi:type II toxin-antitoxin system RelB/DinJ family antitoxin [Komagataeibacter europaeus]|uniref:type II toxin-antitoxin system RelB/DinJ family antitoxin n=1 Tax=Komagataeibacter europaeus TaxID=33995 RepID=UPI000237E4BC|nr:type II toxin-antitoxin system RelB/DinJ family antitoxin [Komagataeibacter europaeus]